MSSPAKKLYTWIATYPKLIVTVALCCSLLSVIYTVQQMTFLTGRDDLMPKNAPFQVDYRAYRAEFGDQEELVAVIEADDAALATKAADALYAALKKEQGAFRDVFYPGGLPFFRSNGLLFMPLDDLKQLRHTLTMAAPVLTDLARSPSIQTLFTSLTGQIDHYLKTPHPEALSSLTYMLTTLDSGFKGFNGSTSALSMDSFLKGGSSSPSQLENAGKQQVITMLPVKQDGAFVQTEHAISAARRALAAVLKQPAFKNVRGGLTGVPVLEYEEMTSSQRDMEIATVLSLSLTIILLLIAFRGLLNVIAAMLSLLVGICLSFAVATAAVGHLNILSMVFAVMLIGLGIEYAIQVVLRYQEELSSGADQPTALEQALSANLRSVIMAASTTALAFVTFVFTDFKGIAELGIIAASGIAICVLTTFTVLPALLVLLQRFRSGTQTVRPPRQLRFTGAALFNRPRLIIAVTGILTLACLPPTLAMRFDYNLMNLQAKGLQSVQYAYTLMRSKENAGYCAVVTAHNKAEAAELTRRLEQLPSVDHVVSPLTFVPDQQQEKLAELAALRTITASITPLPYQENLQVMALPAVFEGFRNRVEALSTQLTTEKKAQAAPVSKFLGTLDQFFSSLEAEKDRNALAMLREFQGSMFQELPDKLTMLKESFAARPVTEADIPQELLKRFTGHNEALLLQVAAKKEIFEREPLEEFVQQVKSVAPHATGEPVMVYESLSILRTSYLHAFIYASIGIAVILLINFRSIRYALLGALPMAVGMLLMVGSMALCNIRFNSANIIVLPLILGIGIDSAIYLLNRYRQGHETPAQVVFSSAGVGVFLNALTIFFSFGALMVARHQGVFSIGAVMSLGMAASVAAFLLFLPALLTLWGRK